MKRVAVIILSLSLAAVSGAAFAEDMSGEDLFKKHCALCHPNGGNIIKPEKTLLKNHLDEHGVKSADDIVHIMRNPGKGMQKFSKEKISDADAKKIAEYILKTFR